MVFDLCLSIHCYLYNWKIFCANMIVCLLKYFHQLCPRVSTGEAVDLLWLYIIVLCSLFLCYYYFG